MFFYRSSASALLILDFSSYYYSFAISYWTVYIFQQSLLASSQSPSFVESMLPMSYSISLTEETPSSPKILRMQYQSDYLLYCLIQVYLTGWGVFILFSVWLDTAQDLLMGWIRFYSASLLSAFFYCCQVYLFSSQVVCCWQGWTILNSKAGWWTCLLQCSSLNLSTKRDLYLSSWSLISRSRFLKMLLKMTRSDLHLSTIYFISLTMAFIQLFLLTICSMLYSIFYQRFNSQARLSFVRSYQPSLPPSICSSFLAFSLVSSRMFRRSDCFCSSSSIVREQYSAWCYSLLMRSLLESDLGSERLLLSGERVLVLILEIELFIIS